MIEMKNKCEKIEQNNECDWWLHGNYSRLNIAQQLHSWHQIDSFHLQIVIWHGLKFNKYRNIHRKNSVANHISFIFGVESPFVS